MAKAIENPRLDPDAPKNGVSPLWDAKDRVSNESRSASGRTHFFASLDGSDSAHSCPKQDLGGMMAPEALRIICPHSIIQTFFGQNEQNATEWKKMPAGRWDDSECLLFLLATESICAQPCGFDFGSICAIFF